MTSHSGQRIRYEELVADNRLNIPLDPAAKRRSASQWTVLGTPVPSLDRVDLMTGRFEFVHNIKLPEMLHGRVVRPPEMGRQWTPLMKRRYATSRVSSKW
jgi:nicotinate dehydrogenase subunit B